MPHCLRDTMGWQVAEPIRSALEARGARPFEKSAFGSVKLCQYLADLNALAPLGEIELMGVCTDVCVVSNALLIKAYLPEVPVAVVADLCAGVTPRTHTAALETMQSCQIRAVRAQETLGAHTPLPIR